MVAGGEIAVRVARAARDHGIASIAVYSDPDADALHVAVADEAFHLPGASSADTYLKIDAVLDVARRAGADAVHPGYGFLSENADFAQAVIDAGMTWIGPSPDAIRALGDKITARSLAQQAGAPLVPGSDGPVPDAAAARAFAEEHGLPIAIKAAFGGGGRGIRVVRELGDVEDAFEATVREAVAAFGRGECFVERFLDRPRHVEAQVLADEHGHVAVLGTRDCSLQRRNQKLVEEAPAPFLTDEQNARLVESSKAILQEAGYVGAGTCEFLVGQDGTISFLEVNTRLQVEHPVSEEITGIDLVREQFRLARGEALGYTDPQPRGHSIEFRLNGEDPGRSFLPAPGRLTTFRMPSGPGVRVDSGVVEGETVSGAFDSMVAKLIVTGADRRQALQRAARALREAEIVGMPSVLPFHRAVVCDPAFAPEIAGSEEPFSVHTRWIETEFANHIEPSALTPAEPAPREARHTVTVEVNGKRVDVTLPTWGEALHTISGAAQRAGAGRRRPRGKRGAPVAAAVSTDALTAPMQGTVVKVAAENGQTVAEGDLIVVVEAMKMEQPLAAHRAGVVSGLEVEPGQTVTAGTVIATIADTE
ncbi:biotin carboxylase N-terminal domain-containing protein [Micrococcus sp. MS-ASIII-49]|uniref:acetyl/propionyl/methylcrotonyl-CoA carboxylase subunit alpha n=1 Tax=Micrococcus sp. MS-ASIII-49 TaxID=1593237 RepID=UPI0009E404F9|nr:biotin carboxylase N-terminal domain-containing protein [Micrococcus sp. MS-ASIII-49]